MQGSYDYIDQPASSSDGDEPSPQGTALKGSKTPSACGGKEGYDRDNAENGHDRQNQQPDGRCRRPSILGVAMSEPDAHRNDPGSGPGQQQGRRRYALRGHWDATEVRDGSQPPMTFDLSVREPAGSHSLQRFVRL